MSSRFYIALFLVLVSTGLAHCQPDSDPASILNKFVMPSVVEIRAEGSQLFREKAVPVLIGKGIGILRRLVNVAASKEGVGVLVDPRGYAITNAHVVSGLKNIIVISNNKDVVRGVVEFTLPERDLAIVSFKPAWKVLPIKFADSGSLKVKDSVFTVTTGPGRRFCSGVVTGLDKSVLWKEKNIILNNLVETDMRLAEGNSGGPLLNADGQLVGMNVSGYLYGKQLSYAIPANSIAAFCYLYFQQIEGKGEAHVKG